MFKECRVLAYFQDEPTAGMDPYAKRFLWDLILSLIQEGRCIILTSHRYRSANGLCYKTTCRFIKMEIV